MRAAIFNLEMAADFVHGYMRTSIPRFFNFEVIIVFTSLSKCRIEQAKVEISPASDELEQKRILKYF